MAPDITVDAGAPNLNLTADEKRAYGQLFRQADTDSVGVVTGEIAVKFFEKTRLDSSTLGEIWQIADSENRGFLTPAGFGIVLRLIGHAQAGRVPTPEVALQPGPLPRFDGITLAPAPVIPQSTGNASPSALQVQGTGGGAIRIPPLTPEKVAQYTALFDRQNPQGGTMLAGDQAKSIFEKSGLPNEMLGRIWQLADTELRGALVLTEFVIAMHLLSSIKNGALRGLPNILPAALYEAATRRGPPGGARQQSPTSTGPTMSAVPRQLSGQAQMRTGSPLGRPPISAQPGDEWLITPGDKARFDMLYDELDKSRKGFITGEEAVPFLSQSNLPEDGLAQIWDLADVNSEGRLNRDTFAVAMYLIRQQRTRKDGSSALPQTLPTNLIPPSFRNQARPPTDTSTSAFDLPPPPQAPPPAQPKSALDDLFGLDSTPTPTPPASRPAPLGPFGAAAADDPFASSPLPPSSPAKPSPTTSSFKPFIPSSSFGRTLTSQATGDSTGSAPSFSRPAPQAASMQDDLLGDNDAEVSKKLTSDSTELANLSNQISSLSKHMQEVQGQRTTTQNELNQSNQQKKNFEQRLTQLRALYEKEAKGVRTLEEQLAASRNATKKIMTDMSMVDASYRDLQGQHQQVATALQADQQENANLKERIKTVNAEIAQIRPQIEKLKSEARQQKGLVAINKKQLATTEGERDKLKAETEELTRSNEEMARQISASPPPAVAAAQVASPALSTASGNNPFFKRSGSTDIMGAFASPPPSKAFTDKSFDDVFGPAFPSVNEAFKPQNTGTSVASAGSFATPATSGTPNVSRQATMAMEPPAPSESRQMSSRFLPFGEPSESLTSSRQVSPPVSRMGQVDMSTSEPASLTPTATPLEAAVTGQSVMSGSDTTKNSLASPTETKPPTSADAMFALPPASDAAKAGPGHSHSRSDPFGPVDDAKAKEDFDSAFASFKNTKAKDSDAPGTVDPVRAFDTEFPPISELEKDDDSDSSSDRGGFDDDFAPGSPASPKQVGNIDAAKPASPGFVETAAKAEPAPEMPAAPAAPMTSTEADDIFGAATPPLPKAEVVVPASLSGPPPPAPKTSFEDVESDFDGLEDAKEGSADDDFATISRSGLDDFNPVFDSSPPAKSESNLTSGAFGAESSFDFASLGSSTGGSTAPAPLPTGQNGAAAAGAEKDGHDWDAIFASLDEPGAEGKAGEAPAAAEAEGKPAALARVVTEDGQHDDPILKNLTSMGYSRADALLALEKYDYNLERAANFLASQS